MRLMQGITSEAMARKKVYCGGCGGDSSGDMMKASTRQAQGDDGTRPAQARQRQCNNCVATEVTREREND
jgi:hypothetical protein